MTAKTPFVIASGARQSCFFGLLQEPQAVSIKPNYDENNSQDTCWQTTPDDEGIRLYIDYIHSKGMKVLLRPYVDVKDWACKDFSHWRGNISPNNVDEWFKSYKSFILKYAQIAQEKNVDMLIVGGELANLSGSAYRTYWQDVIKAVRQVYNKEITYASTMPNNAGASAEYDKVGFWDLVDYAGVDFYPNLSTESVPSKDTLISELGAFKNLLDSFSKSVGKPVIFTEIGFPSREFCTDAPYDSKLSLRVNEACQYHAFDAFFETFANVSYIKGAFIYSDIIDHDCFGACDSTSNLNDDRYTLRGKKAQDIMKYWYGQSE